MPNSCASSCYYCYAHALQAHLLYVASCRAQRLLQPKGRLVSERILQFLLRQRCIITQKGFDRFGPQPFVQAVCKLDGQEETAPRARQKPVSRPLTSLHVCLSMQAAELKPWLPTKGQSGLHGVCTVCVLAKLPPSKVQRPAETPAGGGCRKCGGSGGCSWWQGLDYMTL